jgi:photoactive yellow protein
MDFTRIKFDQADVENVLAKMRPEEIDGLAFGAIELDADGRIVSFNATESRLSGRARDAVVGKLFFSEVAPCTRRPEFYGRFQRLVAGGPSAVFDYVFDYKMSPKQVRVHMKKALLGDRYWILVRWLDTAPAL